MKEHQKNQTSPFPMFTVTSTILLLFTKLETVTILTSCKFSTSVVSSKQKQILLFHYNSIEQCVLIACTSYVLNSLMFSIRKSTFVDHGSFH